MSNEAGSPNRQILKKSISFKNYVSLGFGAIVGIGWVVYSAEWIHSGGPVGAILAFAAGGSLILSIGACYAEMTSAIPVAGGEVAFTFKAFGPNVAFFTGWTLGLTYVSITPFETIAIGALLETIVPIAFVDTLYTVGGYRVTWLTLVPGVMCGIFLTWLNYCGAKSSVRLQTIVMSMLLVCTAIFVTAAIVKGDISNLSPMFATSERSWAAIWSSIISVIVVVPWFLGGFDTIPQAAEERGIDMTRKKLGVAILASIALATLFYVLVILAVGMTMSPAELRNMMNAKDILPTAEVFRVSFGYEWAAKLVLVAALLGLVTTLNSFLIAGSRLLFALGRGGLLPNWFARVSERYGTPVNAIVFVGGIATIGPFVGKAALGTIVSSGSLALTSAMMLTAISAVRLRYITDDLERPYRARVGTLYVGAAVAAVLILLMVMPGSPGRLSSLELWVFAVWMLLGVIAYVVRRASRDMNPAERRIMILGRYDVY